MRGSVTEDPQLLLQVPQDYEANLKAQKRRVRRAWLLAFSSLLLAPLLWSGSLYLIVTAPGHGKSLEIVTFVGVLGFVLALVCIGLPVKSLQRARAQNRVLQLMAVTDFHRSVEGLLQENLRYKRIFLHPACGGETELAGKDYSTLRDPLSLLFKVRCRCCDQEVALKEVFWKDTGENLEQYRENLLKSVSVGKMAFRVIIILLLVAWLTLALLERMENLASFQGVLEIVLMIVFWVVFLSWIISLISKWIALRHRHGKTR